LSFCKINQNMDVEDIIYLIMLLFFLALGFFNKSVKEKKRKEQGQEPKQKVQTDNDSDVLKTPSSPPSFISSSQRREYQSPLLDTVISAEGESMLKGSIFTNEDMDTVKQPEVSSLHPLVKELYSDHRTDELRKAIIYGEIFNKKF